MTRAFDPVLLSNSTSDLNMNAGMAVKSIEETITFTKELRAENFALIMWAFVTYVRLFNLG